MNIFSRIINPSSSRSQCLISIDSLMAILQLLYIFVYIIVIYFIYKLRSKECSCEFNLKSYYLLWWPILHLILGIIAKSNKYTNEIIIITILGLIIYAFLLYLYIEDLHMEECKCLIKHKYLFSAISILRYYIILNVIYESFKRLI